MSGKSLRVTRSMRQRWRVSEDSSRGGGEGQGKSGSRDLQLIVIDTSF